MLIPGFVEHHSHFRGWAAQQHQTDLSDVVDADDLAERVAGCDSAWVRGFGLADELFERITGALAEGVDAALDGRPVVVTSRDQHALFTTTSTLAEIGIELEHLVVPGGVVERDARGVWTGVLREESAWIVRRALRSDLTPDQHRAAIDVAARRGVTHVHDMDGLAALHDWTALHDLDGQLDVGVTVHLLAGDLDAIAEARALERAGAVRIGGLKVFADGTLGSGTALLHAPERPLPGRTPRQGVAITGRGDLETFALRAAKLGLPLLVHAIGDAAATNVVEALDATRDAWRGLESAPRIEHAQLMRVDDIELCAELGIALSVQPTMLITDRDDADARWGAERTSRAYAYRTMHEAGCQLLFGSDAPIEPLVPLASVFAAVHRDGGAHGLPAARGTWHPEQTIDAATAIGAATGWAPRDVDDAADAVLLAGSDPSSWRVVGTRRGARWTHRSVD